MSSNVTTVFIAMNRFKIVPGKEEDFETVWRERDTHLDKVPGFIDFKLLKGPQKDDHTLYASHTIWADQQSFEAWTKSEAFRAAHKNAGDNKPLYLGHPEFEGFETVHMTSP
ncbi:MAG: antibiotic biosynthesis monooxygenase [Pseudomonadota bacterium]